MRANKNGFGNCRIWNRIILSALLTLAFALTGCGGNTGELVYEAEFVDLGISESDIGIGMDFSLCGDELYYATHRSGESDSEKDSYGRYRRQYDIYCMRLEDPDGVRRVPIELENSYIENLKVLTDSDGNYFLAYKIGNGVYAEKYDRDGEKIFRRQVAMKEYTESDIAINEHLVGMVQDGAGNLYLAAKNDIYLLDAEGGSQGTVSLEPEDIFSSINSIACGMDGNVYCAMNRKIYRIDFAACSARETGHMPENFGMAAIREVEFLVANQNKLLLYNLEEDTVTDLVEWQDCDLDTERLEGLTRLEDGRTGVVFCEDSKLRAALIQETDGRGAPRQETVTLGVVLRNENLRKSALAFNRLGGPYRVKVKEYWDNMLDSDMTLNEAIASLNLDIVSGSCPDIVNLQYGNLGSFASKGVLEDLNHFLEESGLKREDFVDAVLEAYTVDGKLLSLPNTFCIQTVAVLSDLVGTKTSWTLDEMMELAESHPDSMLFGYATKQDVLEFCLKMNLSYFLDWEEGSCSFDSEEFRRILEFSDRYPLEAVFVDDLDEIDVQYSSGKVLLCQVTLASPDMISYIYEIYGWEDLTFIGYPTIDGSAGHQLDGAGGAYAIFAKSPHKEGAWSFLETLQDSEGEMMMVYAEGFPAKKDKLEALFEEAMKDPYMINSLTGEISTDYGGNPIRRSISGSATMRDGIIYQKSSYVPIPEEIEEIRRLIGLARPAWKDEEVMAIIREETAAYFHGQKTLDAVVELIDNRVRLYMDEK